MGMFSTENMQQVEVQWFRLPFFMALKWPIAFCKNWPKDTKISGKMPEFISLNFEMGFGCGELSKLCFYSSIKLGKTEYLPPWGIRSFQEKPWNYFYVRQSLQEWTQAKWFLRAWILASFQNMRVSEAVEVEQLHKRKSVQRHPKGRETLHTMFPWIWYKKVNDILHEF